MVARGFMIFNEINLFLAKDLPSFRITTFKYGVKSITKVKSFSTLFLAYNLKQEQRKIF